MENNYQLSRIHNYVNGLMSKEDMYALEREAAEDPFLQDAIDGYGLQNGVNTKPLSLLQQRLETRLQQKSTEKSKSYYSWQRLVVGMVAGVMFVTVCTLVLMRYLPKYTSNLKEVMVNEIFFDYNVSPADNNTALPIGGWGSLYDELAFFGNTSNFEGKLVISFDLDDKGVIKNLSILNQDKIFEDEELENILRNKVKWTGDLADFKLEIFKMSDY